MKMFSDCSGECCVCACGGACLAGHGDDDFYPADTEQIIKRLETGQYSSYRDIMIGELRKRGVVYSDMKYMCEYITGDNWLILEPEDWSTAEWNTILKIFGMDKADRIVIRDYKFEALGRKKEKNYA